MGTVGQYLELECVVWRSRKSVLSERGARSCSLATFRLRRGAWKLRRSETPINIGLGVESALSPSRHYTPYPSMTFAESTPIT
jgi:hypothetical protein